MAKKRVLPRDRTGAVRAPLAMPGAFRVEASSGELVITRRWRSETHVFLAGVVVATAGLAVLRGADLAEPRTAVFTFFAAIVAYYALAGLVNSTTVTATFDGLRVRHGPLPWSARADVPRSDVVQLYVLEIVSKGGRTGTSRHYHLSAKVRSGRDVIVVFGVPSPEHARFLEQELERYLGITDAPVPGQHRDPGR